MSIRFRFTLIYNLILALTLAVFGVVLYSIQAQTTLDALKTDLRASSERLSGAVVRVVTNPGWSQPQRDQPPPMPFETFSSEQTFQKLPEREIVRVLDASGSLVASPFGRSEDALPLSSDGLQDLQIVGEWWETAEVEDQRMLIYSRLVSTNGQLGYILQIARPLTERDRSLRFLGTTLITASLLTILVAFGIGWAFSGITLAPIQRITQTAQAIGAERDFTRRVAYSGPQDEVGQLAKTFNAMLARLQDAYQQVAHSLELQRNFVADVSHELRTPLTTLRGNLGLLRRTPPIPAEEQVDILSDMVDESDRLIRLVNDLLVLARADAGRNLDKEPIAIVPVIEETCRQAHQIDPQREIALHAPPELTLLGDRDACKQILLIALDNALKHSEGPVQVTAVQNAAHIEIRVQDYGAGIPADKLEHIFDRFFRSEEAAAIPGFGLGLPIAKALVEAQGGTIRMESEASQGSVLIIQFPAV